MRATQSVVHTQDTIACTKGMYLGTREIGRAPRQAGAAGQAVRQSVSWILRGSDNGPGWASDIQGGPVLGLVPWPASCVYVYTSNMR